MRSFDCIFLNIALTMLRGTSDVMVDIQEMRVSF